MYCTLIGRAIICPYYIFSRGQFHDYNLTLFQLTIEKELQNAQDRISNLHEGIGTTNSNYEEQISMLSEHVANMNEKLAEKTEEIQVLLSYQITLVII